MKVFFVASAICLVALVGQSAGIRISESETESASLNERLRLKIHQTETIRPIEPKQKEKVFINRSKPLYVTGKSRHVVVPASKPIVVKPEAVVIRQKGDVEVRPIHITKQPPPLIVTKKIVKLHQPVIKKYYVEKYRKHEVGSPERILSQKISKKTCDCPVSEHVFKSKLDFTRDDKSRSIEIGEPVFKVQQKGWTRDYTSRSVESGEPVFKVQQKGWTRDYTSRSIESGEPVFKVQQKVWTKDLTSPSIKSGQPAFKVQQKGWTKDFTSQSIESGEPAFKVQQKGYDSSQSSEIENEPLLKVQRKANDAIKAAVLADAKTLRTFH